jgi:hypothetical protein
MISIDNRLVYGKFMSELHKKLPNEEIERNISYSDKFTNVKKIICSAAYIYILNNNAIYYSTVFTSNDNFEKLTCVNNQNIEFIDIERSACYCYAVSINGTLYRISNNIVSELAYNDIQAIYSGHTRIFIIKKNNNKYYHKSGNKLLFIGCADCINITNDNIILINDNKITFFNLKSLQKYLPNQLLIDIINNNIDILCKIPNGSYLKFFNENDNMIMNVPTDINAIILYSTFTVDANPIAICGKTGNVYSYENSASTNQVTLIPELENCTMSKLDSSRYARTKNAAKNQ